MGANLDLLEDVVGRAARRLVELGDQNRKLATESRSLRQQLASDDTGGAWRRERAAVLTGLRQALAELREGG